MHSYFKLMLRSVVLDDLQCLLLHCACHGSSLHGVLNTTTDSAFRTDVHCLMCQC